MKTAIVIISILVVLCYLISVVAASYIRSDSTELLKMKVGLPTTASIIRGLCIFLYMVFLAADIILMLIFLL